MTNIWEQFDKAIDVEGLQADIKEAAKTGNHLKRFPTVNMK